MAEFTPEKCKQIALARLDIVHQWLEFRKKSQNKLQADYDFVKLHNTSASHLFNVLGKISRGSLHRWYAMLNGTEDYTKLLPQYKYSGVNDYRTVLNRAKYFTDDKGFSELGFNGLYSKLGMETVFARPYNARAKVIERFFKEFQEGFEKLLQSYIGSSIQNKPAYMMINEKLHKTWHNEYIPTIEEAIKMIDMWLGFKNSQPCPNAPDKTIAEVLSERKRQNIDINTLDDLMLSTEVKTIQRNGIRFLNCDYFDERLYGFKNKVLIKYNLFDLTNIKVFTPKGEYLCTAERVTETHPMAQLLDDVKDYEDYKQKIVRQRQLKKKVVESVKNI